MQRPCPQRISEMTLLTPWQDPLATAAPTPWRGWESVPGSGELWRRVTAWYAELRALPRRMRRALQRQLALPLVSVALLLALGQGLSQAGTIVVDGVTCTLVDAINAANTDTAQGGCPAGSGADILVLEPPGSTVTLTRVDNSSYGPTGLPVIRTVITIAGQGGTIARASSAPAFRLMAVNASGDFTLQKVIVTGGVAHGDSNTSGGGGVLNYSGTVTIEDSTISGNSDAGVRNLMAGYYGNANLTVIRSIISGNSGFGVHNENGSFFGPAYLTVIQSLISDNSGPGVCNCSYYKFSDATLTLTQSTISGNSGGGVANFGWWNRAMISDSTISGNSASGLANGGGSVTLTHSTISDNTASDGGGVYNYVGRVTLTDSTISDNTATGRGGGVYNRTGTVTIEDSTISGNTAADGGGVVNEGSLGYDDYGGRYPGYGILTLTQSTITGNTATGRGGGVVNRADSYGGATLTLTNSTIAGNRASAGGGLVNTADGDDSPVTATLLQSTITGNTAIEHGGGVVTSAADAVSHATVTLTLVGSLVAGNLAPTAPEVLHSAGTLTANAFNLFGGSGTAGVVGFTPGPTDVVPSAPLTAILDPVLADHGGPTLTHALVPGSPAIDAIPRGTHGCGTTLISDQRARARPQPAGGPCDIGAYEVEVARQALGAWVTGFTPHTVSCKNVTTGHVVTLSDPASPWDCEAAGLEVTAGDRVSILVRGPVAKGTMDVGGAVVGMAPSSAGCTNLTTGQQVKFQMMRGATAASCVAAGLVVHPGESVQMSVQGGAE